jgi:hypothetical protein
MLSSVPVTSAMITDILRAIFITFSFDALPMFQLLTRLHLQVKHSW